MPGRSPGLDFTTYPTPEGEPREWGGGEAIKPRWAGGGGAETTCNGQARGEGGAGSRLPPTSLPGSPPPPPPSPPALTSCAFKFRPVPLGLPESSALPKPEEKQDTEEATPRTRGDGAGAPEGAEGGGPQGPARHLPSAHPESQPRPCHRPTTAPPRPLPRTPARGERAPPPFPPTPASGAPRPPPPPNRPKAPRTF